MNTKCNTFYIILYTITWVILQYICYVQVEKLYRLQHVQLHCTGCNMYSSIVQVATLGCTGFNLYNFFSYFFFTPFSIPATPNLDFRSPLGDTSDAHFHPKVGSETSLENRFDLKLFLMTFWLRKPSISHGMVIENVLFA